MIATDSRHQQLPNSYPAKSYAMGGALPKVKPWKTVMPSAPGGEGAGSLANPLVYVNPSVGLTSDGAASFSAANKEYLTILSNASLQTGDIDFEVGAWVYLASTGVEQTIIGKYLASPNLEFLLYISGNNKPTLIVSDTGSSSVSVGWGSALSSGTWYYIRTYHDSVNNKIGISVNNATVVTLDYSAGTHVDSSPLRLGIYGVNMGYFNGRIDSAYFTKRISTPSEATALYNAGTGRTYADLTAGNGLSSFQTALTSWWDMNEEEGTRYDAKGTNHLTSAAGQIIAPPVYGSELIGNPGFETAGAGGADVFGTWGEYFGSGDGGLITDETTLVHSGAHAAKLSFITGRPDLTANSINVIAGQTYYVSFWTRGDGTKAGYYRIRDNSNAADIQTVATTGISSTTYTLFSRTFIAPAGCSEVNFWLMAPPSAGDAYFDDVSLKQTTTPAINNGGFDLVGAGGADVFASWTESVAGTSTVNSENATPYHGARAFRIDADASNSAASVSAAILTVGRRYKATYYAKASSGTPSISVGGVVQALTTSYAQYTAYFTATSTAFTITNSTGAASLSLYVDSVTLESLSPTSDAGIAAGVATDGNFAAQFNGTNQYLSHADATTLDFDTANFALFGSFYRDKLGQYTIAAKYQDANNYYTLECNASNILTFRAYAGSTKIVEVVGTAALAVGNWYTFALVVDRATAANCKLYINGANDTAGTPTTAATDISNTGAFEIGRYTTSLYFGGRIDGVGLLKRVLTTGEIASLYNVGKGCKYAALPSTVKTDLVSFWNLDEKSGTRYDSTANANDLTDNGTTLYGHGVDYNEGIVAKATDQSGNLNNFTQATLAKRPAYDIIGIGGKPTILMDGTDDTLANTGDLVGAAGVTWFGVFKARGWGGGSAGRLISNGKFIVNVNVTNNCLNVTSDGATTAVSATNSIVLATSYIVAVTRTSAGVTNIYIAGALSGTQNQNAGTPAAGSATYIGNRAAWDRAFDGHIAEVLIIPSIPSVATLNQYGSYLAQKYGLAWTPGV